MIMKTHYHYLLLGSPWPFIISVSVFNFMFSLLLFFKSTSVTLLVFSCFIVFFNSMFWWFSYSMEMNLCGSCSFSLEFGIKWGMILFILSEVFFFFSFFWSYFHYFLSPTLEVSMEWPPVMVEAFKFQNIPLINTLILLGSGVTVTIAHFQVMKGEIMKFSLFLGLTIMLGVYFTILQLVEYNSAFFSISDGSFGTSFFVLTGFHGIHVLIGSCFLLVSLIRSMKLYSSDNMILSFELASWYWHFVDVVWIFLYFFLYYLNN